MYSKNKGFNESSRRSRSQYRPQSQNSSQRSSMEDRSYSDRSERPYNEQYYSDRPYSDDQNFESRENFRPSYDLGRASKTDRSNYEGSFQDRTNYGFASAPSYTYSDRMTSGISGGSPSRPSSYDSAAGQYSGQHSGKGPKGYRRSDERIHEDVCEALSHHSDINASEVEVKVENGDVTLTGTAESRQMKRLIEDCIDGLSGVQDIYNEIKVQSPGSSRNSGSNETQFDSRLNMKSSSSSDSKRTTTR